MDLRPGMRVDTPDGEGVVMNFLLVDGRTAAVFVALDADRAVQPEFPESQWKTYAPRILKVRA